MSSSVSINRITLLAADSSSTATVSGSVAIESYDWSFGDNTSKTTTGGQTSKVYNATGTFHVKVIAHPTDGSTGVGDIDLKVNP